mgnify:CR=1 FL=1
MQSLINHPSAVTVEEIKKNISIKKNDMYQARLKKIYKKYS